MSTPRYSHDVAELGGKIYAIGGTNGSIVGAFELRSEELFDRTTSTWAPIADMSVARDGVAVSVLNSRVYAIGGIDGIGWNSVEAYEPKANKWSTVEPMKTIRWGLRGYGER